MPFPTVLTPENTMANFREILRWANELPYANDDSFVPYFINYVPDNYELDWDIDLTEIMQAKFTTDLMPAGMWLVVAYASVAPVTMPTNTVGMETYLSVEGPNSFYGERDAVGVMTSGSAVKVVTDIDFTLEEITYEWFLPPINGVVGEEGLMGSSISYMNVIKVGSDGGVATSDDLAIKITAHSTAAYLADPTLGPEMTYEDVPTRLSCWALRLSDGYNVPTALEDVTPA